MSATRSDIYNHVIARSDEYPSLIGDRRVDGVNSNPIDPIPAFIRSLLGLEVGDAISPRHSEIIHNFVDLLKERNWIG
jgi:hypothetical protein